MPINQYTILALAGLRVNAMLDWMGEKIWAIVTLVPAVFVAEDSPNFMAIRAMFGLLLIVMVAYLVAMRPFRAAIAAAWPRYQT